MRFKYKFSIPKIKCNGDISTGFLVSKDKVITTVHSIKEYLIDNENLIEVIFQDKSGNKVTRIGSPIVSNECKIEEMGEIIALKLDQSIENIDYLECIKYTFENLENAYTYGYPAVRENDGTLIEVKIQGYLANADLDIKIEDSIKDYSGCSGGPLIYKNYVVGVALAQISEDGLPSRIDFVNLNKYEQYFKEIGLELFEKSADIYQFEENLMNCTNPKISLDFFNYEEKEFEENFLKMLSTQGVIYLQGKTREEVIGYTLFIIKSKVRHLLPNVVIVDKLKIWDELKLKGTYEDKILIPNFNANELTIIPNNINIIFFGEEDFIGNKDPLILRKRTLKNMSEKLKDEIDDAMQAYALVSKCNGLYSIFKRKVFDGKSSKPSWEEQNELDLLPALLASSWENNTKDQLFLEKLAGIPYEKYIDSIKNVINKEDPFVLHYENGYENIFKLANLEEAWEILFSQLSEEKLQLFKDLALGVLSEVAVKYDLPVEEHYRASLLTEKKKEYSSTLKEGIIRSLIFLSLGERNSVTNNKSHLVNQTVEVLLNQTKQSKQWFAIAEFLPLLAESAPKIFIDFIEKEANNDESKMWDLFEKTDYSFMGRTYYTHVLWALEKLFCDEELVVRAIKIVVKLAERKVRYKISNSPMTTLNEALSAWHHQINLDIDDKCELVEQIVEDSSIGWELLELLSPDRSNNRVVGNFNYYKYRPYEIKYKLEFTDQLLKLYKKYTLTAINVAGNDLNKWSLILKKCLFIELGLYDLVKEKLIEIIPDIKLDEQKYGFKETIRELIYKHRYYTQSEWALEEENVKKIEELFDLVVFENKMYNHLHLFVNEELISLKPKPYDKNKTFDWAEEQKTLLEQRLNALKLIISNGKSSIWELIRISKNYDTNSRLERIVGQITASEIDQFNLDSNFINEALENLANELIDSYIKTIYRVKGISVIEYVLTLLNEHDELVISILNGLNIDRKFLDIISSLSNDVESRYWKSTIIHSDTVDESVRRIVWLKLIEYKNFYAALRMTHFYFRKDLEKNIALLEEVLLNQSMFRINNQNNYLIIEAFKNIYTESNLQTERSLYLRICKLEWAYFDMLTGQLQPKYLMKELQTEPILLAELIRYAYKSSKANNTLNEMEKSLAKQALNILFKLKFCPCIDEKNNISEEELEAWTKVFLDEIDKSGHSEIGRQILGECFSYSPVDEDIFPHPTICKIFEKNYTKDIGKGFTLGVMNNRGAYWGTNGKEEEKLALKYELYSKKIKIKFSKVSQELLRISEVYKRQASEERERASYDF